MQLFRITFVFRVVLHVFALASLEVVNHNTKQNRGPVDVHHVQDTHVHREEMSANLPLKVRPT